MPRGIPKSKTPLEAGTTPVGATSDNPNPHSDQVNTGADQSASVPSVEAGAEQEKAKPVKTVRMKRDESFPAPHTADVHPDEVANWKLHDWVEA